MKIKFHWLSQAITFVTPKVNCMCFQKNLPSVSHRQSLAALYCYE